jgi:ComF family protein
MLFIPPVDRIIHHYKYQKKTKLSILLGRAMATIIRSDYVLKNADMIIPVPLFWWKRLRRGYDQAALLSATVSQECSVPVANSIRRIKNTKTQTRLDEQRRRENVMNAFTAEAARIKDKSVLLIDDVLTTGATMNECARVLKDAGAKAVYSCVAAITPG